MSIDISKGLYRAVLSMIPTANRTITFPDRDLTVADDADLTAHEATPHGGGGVTDHGALTGLADDDHPQYHTAAEVAADIATHAGLADPHPTYTTAAELATGIAGHAAAGDPHPTYATDTDLSTHAAAADPHPVYHTAAEVAADIATHAGLADPHPGYQTAAEEAANIATHAGLPNAHHAEAHVVTGADHTVSGLTPGDVLTALTGTSIGWQPAGTPGAHVLATGTALGTAHTISGAAAGEVLRALSATTAAFDVLGLSDVGAATGDYSLATNKLTNVKDPTNAQDAATKAYVDTVASGLSPKASVRLATAAALPTLIYANGAAGVGATLTAVAIGVLTIDGTAVALGDRLLVKDQVTGFQNGIYTCTTAGAAGVAFILTRATDTDTSAEIFGSFVFVETGTANASSGFVNANATAPTMGTDAITFTQFSGAGEITAGAGMTKTGNTLDVVGTAARILVNADSVDIASNYVGQASITTIGTIAAGVWQGTVVDLAHGGTGNTTGAITDAQHGVRTLSAAHALPDISGALSTTQHGTLSAPSLHPFTSISGAITTTQHGALGALANAHALADITGYTAPAAYVPTLTNIGGTAPTVIARFEKIGKRILGHVQINMVAGTTFSAGNLGVSAPATAQAANIRCGIGTMFDSSASQLMMCVVALATTGRFEFQISAVTNFNVTNTVPWTWATSDVLNFEFQYEAA